MTKLVDIEGIGASYATKLSAVGVSSLEDLLQKGSDPKGRSSLADASGVSQKLLLKWINRADLSRIKGIATQYADLLEVAGVDTVPELAQRNPDNLCAKMVDVNTEKKLVRKTPSASQVSSWVAPAKSLPRAIHY
ncbi:MAG TPA: DUF4332 domain-containing protein [Gammaproteobacteria bacterium]|nr:DUF4332 domain-containing protein [Gammaproteobacteria bacterium]